MLACNCLIPQALWSKQVRDNVIVVWIICVLINVGMWTERFMIIAGGLTNDFLPSSFRTFHPSLVDIMIYVGTLGFFSMLFLLALRVIPIVPVSEVKELRHELAHTAEAQGA
jgi:Ni/Fe-hydrogenase subunit HybB-like protein